MAKYRKIVRIFIASPSDLTEERTQFPSIIDEVNRIKANPNSLHLEAVGWEDTLPGKGRPQELINKDIETCDLVVMLLWKRWGTETGKYSSGFEEEYEMARSMNKKTGSPEIWLYFRAVPDDMLADPGTQLRRVLDFRQKIELQRQFLYCGYETTDNWMVILREHLCRWIDRQPPFCLPSSESPDYSAKMKSLEAQLEKASQEHSTTARLLAIEAQNRADSGEVTKAEELFARASASSQDPQIAIQHGIFLLRIGSLSKAEETFTKLLSLSESMSDRALQSVASTNLAVVYQTRGDLKAAEAMHKEALAIDQDLGAKKDMAADYGNLGVIYETRGDLKAAERMCKKALALHKELGAKEGMAADYGNLGGIYHIRGDLKAAERMYKKSLAAHKELGAKEDTAKDYGNLGVICHDCGNMKAAERMYNKALAINQELGSKGGLARDYANLGILRRNCGDLKRAKTMQEMALAIDQEIGSKEGMAADYANLGAIHQTRGNSKAAENMYKKALDLFEEVGSKEGMACNFWNLGIIYQMGGNLKDAETMYKKASSFYGLVGNTAKADKARSQVAILRKSKKGSRE